MSSRDLRRLEEVQLILKEKQALTESAQRLIELLDSRSSDMLSIKKETLNISNHISAIAGFCDNRTQQQAARINTLLGMFMVPDTKSQQKSLFIDAMMKPILPILVGIQVDFTKEKFRSFSIEVALKELSAKVKALR